SLFALAITSSPPTAVYAAPFGGVSKSTDGGASWVAMSAGLDNPVDALAIDPVTSSNVYAGTDGGAAVFKSTDAGAHWHAAGTGIFTTYVSVLIIDPTAPQTLYAGTFLGIFKSTDAAASWHFAGTGLSNGEVHSLAIDPITPSTLYAGTTGGQIFKSTNSGTA